MDTGISTARPQGNVSLHMEFTTSLLTVSDKIQFDSTWATELNITHSSADLGVELEPVGHWSALLLIFVIISGIIGNVLVCVAVRIEKRLQNDTNLFLVSLAVADLLVSCVVVPGCTVQEFIGYWPFGFVLCDAWQTCDVMLCTSSIMHMCTISIDRYIGIKSPMLMRRRSTSMMGLKIGVVWLISLIIASPVVPLGVLRPQDVMSEDVLLCAISNRPFFIYGSLAAFFIPLIIMLVAYTLSIHLLSNQSRRLGQPVPEHGTTTNSNTHTGIRRSRTVKRKDLRGKLPPGVSPTILSLMPPLPLRGASRGRSSSPGSEMLQSPISEEEQENLSNTKINSTDFLLLENGGQSSRVNHNHQLEPQLNHSNSIIQKIKTSSANHLHPNRLNSISIHKKDTNNLPKSDIGLLVDSRSHADSESHVEIRSHADNVSHVDSRSQTDSRSHADSVSHADSRSQTDSRSDVCADTELEEIWTRQSDMDRSLSSESSSDKSRCRCSQQTENQYKPEQDFHSFTYDTSKQNSIPDCQKNVRRKLDKSNSLFTDFPLLLVCSDLVPLHSDQKLESDYINGRKNKIWNPDVKRNALKVNGSSNFRQPFGESCKNRQYLLDGADRRRRKSENFLLYYYSNKNSCTCHGVTISNDSDPCSDSLTIPPTSPKSTKTSKIFDNHKNYRKTGLPKFSTNFVQLPSCESDINSDRKQGRPTDDVEMPTNNETCDDAFDENPWLRRSAEELVEEVAQDLEFNTSPELIPQSNTSNAILRPRGSAETSLSNKEQKMLNSNKLLKNRHFEWPNLSKLHINTAHKDDHKAGQQCAVNLGFLTSPSESVPDESMTCETAISTLSLDNGNIPSISLPSNNKETKIVGDTCDNENVKQTLKSLSKFMSLKISRSNPDFKVDEPLEDSENLNGGQDSDGSGCVLDLKSSRRDSLSSSASARKSKKGPDKFKFLVQKHSATLRVAGILLVKRENNKISAIQSVQTEKKAIKVLGTMFTIFVVCWAPFFTANLLNGACGERCAIDDLVFRAFLWLGYVSSTLNPVIYTVFNKTFRRTFRDILLCRRTCDVRCRKTDRLT